MIFIDYADFITDFRDRWIVYIRNIDSFLVPLRGEIKKHYNNTTYNKIFLQHILGIIRSFRIQSKILPQVIKTEAEEIMGDVI